MNLTINKSLKDKLPDFNVIAYHITFNDSFDVMNKSNEIDLLLSSLYSEYQAKYNYEEIPTIPKLKETRDGYKTLGKDPSHTRPACEALLRRVIKNNPLYRLGDVIDIGNILSIKTQRSVCVVDYKKLVGDVEIRIGNIDDSYNGIGRGIINVSNIPLYVDSVGPFGCPTSDTLRTVVDKSTHEILVMIICFSSKDLTTDEECLINLYKKYTSVKDIIKL